MTLKEKLVLALYVTTSVAIVVHSTVQIAVLIQEERREAKLMKKRIEEIPLSI